MINIRLPWPPTVNTYYTVARNRKILSKKGREYKLNALTIKRKRRILGRLEVNIDAYPPDRRKRDMDNILKPILDVLGDAGVYADDSQIDILRVRRRDVEKPGYVRVYISEIESE